MPQLEADRAGSPAGGASVTELPHRHALRTEAADGQTAALHLHEAVALVRDSLDLAGVFTDGEILASLDRIAAAATPRDRWLAAFDSQLGQWLSLKGADPNTALSALLSLLPALRS